MSRWPSNTILYVGNRRQDGGGGASTHNIVLHTRGLHRAVYRLCYYESIFKHLQDYSYSIYKIILEICTEKDVYKLQLKVGILINLSGCPFSYFKSLEFALLVLLSHLTCKIKEGIIV